MTQSQRLQLIQEVKDELQIMYFPFCCGDPYKIFVHHRFSVAVDELKNIEAAVGAKTLTKIDMSLQIAVSHCLYQLEEGYVVDL